MESDRVPDDPGATMYQMWAEHDPAVEQPSLLWHVITKDDNAKSLCGRLLGAPSVSGSDLVQAESFCGPCMTSVRQAMAQPAAG
ncbi:hypothetical protein F4556_000763 [Kitasatospora gansuensis]|uniref:Uncharacterized protein n=1 Tax=Kitasatospora gansuensis TaxID=258050 RepID=A0A7W7S7C1_9ACTN|nr:hypothetical protein [Kitasatospora gansuensis]MBB4945228.1 hypothetical protein [Kitasatospora gansuensis]